MNQGTEIERYVQDPTLLVDLCRELIERLDNEDNKAETAAKEAQLREIARAIEKLEKQCVPVPDAFRSEKTRLASELATKGESLIVMDRFREGLEELLHDVRQRCRRQQHHNGEKARQKRSRSPKTDRHILRRLLIEALNELGGTARKNELYQRVEKKYEGRFLPGDFEYFSDGKRIAWKNKCDREGVAMRKEGLLRTDSPRNVWQLREDET